MLREKSLTLKDNRFNAELTLVNSEAEKTKVNPINLLEVVKLGGKDSGSGSFSRDPQIIIIGKLECRWIQKSRTMSTLNMAGETPIRESTENQQSFKPTAMYGLQPASLVLAMESTSWPLMPKSQSFMFPFLSNRMFDGLMSACRHTKDNKAKKKKHDAMTQNKHVNCLEASYLGELFSSFPLSG